MDIIEQKFFLGKLLKNSREEEKEIQSRYNGLSYFEKDKEKEETLKIQFLLATYRSAIIEDLIHKAEQLYYLEHTTLKMLKKQKSWSFRPRKHDFETFIKINIQENLLIIKYEKDGEKEEELSFPASPVGWHNAQCYIKQLFL